MVSQGPLPRTPNRQGAVSLLLGTSAGMCRVGSSLAENATEVRVVPISAIHVSPLLPPLMLAVMPAIHRVARSPSGAGGRDTGRKVETVPLLLDRPTPPHVYDLTHVSAWTARNRPLPSRHSHLRFPRLRRGSATVTSTYRAMRRLHILAPLCLLRGSADRPWRERPSVAVSDG